MLVAAKRKREVRHAARHVRAGQICPDPARRLDERQTIVVVLFDAGGDGEDVGIEDDVLRWKSDLADQDVVCAPRDPGLTLEGVGLPLLVEAHHYDGGAVAAYDAGLADELRLAFLE